MVNYPLFVPFDKEYYTVTYCPECNCQRVVNHVFEGWWFCPECGITFVKYCKGFVKGKVSSLCDLKFYAEKLICKDCKHFSLCKGFYEIGC